MTASLTENSFPSARCHYELNVSSTWWMDLSAKIYFDQVSAPFCATPWLSPFLPSSPSSCHLLFFFFLSLLFFVKQLRSIGFFFSCHTVDKHDVLQGSVSPSPEPCVSESVCVCMCMWHWSWLHSVRQPSRVIDWSSAEWPETRRTYAELF